MTPVAHQFDLGPRRNTGLELLCRAGAGLLLACLLALMAQACADSDPTSTSPGSGFERLRLPQIELDPDTREVSLAVGGLPVEAVIRYPIRVRNTGERELRLHGVELHYSAPTDEPAPSFVLNLPPEVSFEQGPYILRPTGEQGTAPEELILEVVLLHFDDEPRTARLVIESDSHLDPEIEIVFTTEEGFPVARVTPDPVDFGTLQGGDLARVPLTIINSGRAVLELSGFQMAGHQGFTLVDEVRERQWTLDSSTEAGVSFNTPHLIPAGESLSLTVEYEALTPERREAQLVLFTNTDENGGAITRRLLANSHSPRAEVEPTVIDFGRIAVGATGVRLVRLLSHGSAPLQVTELTLDQQADFGLDLSEVPGFGGAALPTESDPLIIEPNDFVDLRILFTPEAELLDQDGIAVAQSDTLTIASNSFERAHTVSLSGTGVISTCPEAHIHVLDGTEVSPQTVVRLRSDESYSSCGDIVDHAWSVEQPPGAGGTFLPSASFANPSFPCDAAGTYRFCLEVMDSCGLLSCEPACEEVVVIPDSELHLQLLWRTPNAPPPSPDRPRAGGDLDLHLLHPYARLSGSDLTGDGVPDGWFHQIYDCFWGNPQPEWGSFSPSTNDNPRLDRDDTSGPGPENINLPEPEDLSSLPPELVAQLGGAPVSYRAGVHYWNDHGFGASYATLRVFVRGEKVYESPEVRLMPLDMWDAVTIEWPSGRVDPVPGHSDGLLITPGYQNPAFVAP